MSPASNHRAELFDRYNSTLYEYLQPDLTERGLARAEDNNIREFGGDLHEDRSLPILEIGCGHGAFLTCCAQLGYQSVHGVYISREQVAFCHERGLTGVVCDDGLGYLSQSEVRFGSIVMSDVLEHLPKVEIPVLLLTIYDHLISGGRLVVLVPNMSNPLNLRTRHVDLTHEVGFTQESLAGLLNWSGFEIVGMHGSISRHRGFLSHWFLDQIPWFMFRVFLEKTMPLDQPILKGKNLIAVGESRALSTEPEPAS